MNPNPTISPLRATMFYSASLFLFITFGFSLQRRFQLSGLMAMQLLFFLGLSVLVALVLDQRPVAEVFRLRALSISGVAKSVLLGFLAWGLAYTVSALMLMLVDGLGGQMPEQIYRLYTSAPFPLAILGGALLPAVGEEFVFRGYIQRHLAGFGAAAGVLLTGLLFGMMHLSLVRLLPLTLLGVVFAAAVQRAGSLFPSIIMHFVNNATALSLFFLFRRTDRSVPESPEPSLLAILFLLAALALLGSATWSLVRSFGPGDLARPTPAPPAVISGPPAPVQRAAARAERWLALIPLLPALLIYTWAVVAELRVVF